MVAVVVVIVVIVVVVVVGWLGRRGNQQLQLIIATVRDFTVVAISVPYTSYN